MVMNRTHALTKSLKYACSIDWLLAIYENSANETIPLTPLTK
jgi:hypothetical protein